MCKFSAKAPSRLLRSFSLVLLGLASAFTFSLSGVSTASAETVAVEVGPGSDIFVPSAVNINVGDTVKWIWKSDGHSVEQGDTFNAPDPLFNSGIQDQPFTFSYTFTTPGTVNYYCRPHFFLGMTGTVTVVGDPTPTPTPTPSPTPTATPSPTPTASPSPTPTATPSPTPSPSPSPSATPTPTPPAQPLNISTRLQVLTGDQVPIGGFIITDTDAKEVILRAIGPSLSGFGIPNPLADPVLELHASDGSLITENDDWQDTQQADIQATGFQPLNPKESAILITLKPGSYTAIVRGKDNGTGVGLVEAYDLNEVADSQLGNISTRGAVGTETDVLIGGFILGGAGDSADVVVRALGPVLADFGVTGALADPTLELRDGDGNLVQSNDNWNDTEHKAELLATQLEPSKDLESAIFASLPAGNYTAVVAGAGGTTGVGLVEVYRVP